MGIIIVIEYACRKCCMVSLWNFSMRLFTYNAFHLAESNTVRDELNICIHLTDFATY